MQAPTDSVVLAPVSPKVAALLHALQAEILSDIEAANDGRSVPPGAIVLLPHGKAKAQRHIEAHGSRQVWCEYDSTSTINLTCWRDAAIEHDLHPGHWFATEARLDEEGNRWQRHLGKYVFDDFGALVPVEAS